MRVLIRILLALALFYGLSKLDLGHLLREAGFGPSLEQCVTAQRVREFLDGETVYRVTSLDDPGDMRDMLQIRQERISSLKMRSEGGRSILIRFDYQDMGQLYSVECTFLYFTDDSPDGHRHRWVEFQGKALPKR